MTIIEVPLALSKLYVCSICGFNSASVGSLARCVQAPVSTMPPPLVLYQEVRHFGPPYANASSPELRKERSTVKRLFYAQPGGTLFFSGYRNTDKVEIHELCVELAQSFVGPNEYRPWKEGDTTIACDSMSYKHFLLWQEGDRSKLEAAGLLIPRPHTSKVLSKSDSWASFLRRFF